MSPIHEDDIFLEMLEVIFNCILYLREVYPAAIFRKRKMYNMGVFVSIYPPLTEYICNVLRSVQQLKKARKLHKIELLILNAKADDEDDGNRNNQVLEKFVFQVKLPKVAPNVLSPKSKKQSDDAYFIEMEEKIRQGLLQLSQMTKKLKPLEIENRSFRVNLITTQAAFVDFTTANNSIIEKFDWIQQIGNSMQSAQDSRLILPVFNSDLLSFHIETYAQLKREC